MAAEHTPLSKSMLSRSPSKILKNHSIKKKIRTTLKNGLLRWGFQEGFLELFFFCMPVMVTKNILQLSYSINATSFETKSSYFSRM